MTLALMATALQVRLIIFVSRRLNTATGIVFSPPIARRNMQP